MAAGDRVEKLGMSGEGDAVQIDKGRLLQPWKKERAICIIRRGEIFQVLERGFLHQEYGVEPAKLRKVLKGMCRREFPHSNKVWLTLLGTKEADAFAGLPPSS